MKELKEKTLHLLNDFYKVSRFNIQRKAQSPRRRWTMNTTTTKRSAIIFERSRRHEKLNEMKQNQNLEIRTTKMKKIKRKTKKRTHRMSNTKSKRILSKNKKKIRMNKVN